MGSTPRGQEPEICVEYRHVITGMCQDLMHIYKDPLTAGLSLSPELEAAYEDNGSIFEHRGRDVMKLQQAIIDPLQRPTILLPELFPLSKL